MNPETSVLILGHLHFKETSVTDNHSSVREDAEQLPRFRLQIYSSLRSAEGSL